MRHVAGRRLVLQVFHPRNPLLHRSSWNLLPIRSGDTPHRVEAALAVTTLRARARNGVSRAKVGAAADFPVVVHRPGCQRPGAAAAPRKRRGRAWCRLVGHNSLIVPSRLAARSPTAILAADGGPPQGDRAFTLGQQFVGNVFGSKIHAVVIDRWGVDLVVKWWNPVHPGRWSPTANPVPREAELGGILANLPQPVETLCLQIFRETAAQIGRLRLDLGIGAEQQIVAGLTNLGREVLRLEGATDVIVLGGPPRRAP